MSAIKRLQNEGSERLAVEEAFSIFVSRTCRLTTKNDVKRKRKHIFPDIKMTSPFILGTRQETSLRKVVGTKRKAVRGADAWFRMENKITERSLLSLP